MGTLSEDCPPTSAAEHPGRCGRLAGVRPAGRYSALQLLRDGGQETAPWYHPSLLRPFIQMVFAKRGLVLAVGLGQSCETRCAPSQGLGVLETTVPPNI